MLLYFIPTFIQKKRLLSILSCAQKNGFQYSEVFTKNVTHIVTEIEMEEIALKQIPNSQNEAKNVHLVSLKWFFESVKNCEALPVEKYKLKRKKTSGNEESNENDINSKIPRKNHYLCQKPTLLNHKNLKLVQSLEILAKEAELRDNPGDYPRALAFRKACTALKQSEEVNSTEEISNIPDIGPHSLRILNNIFEDGHCSEVKQIEESEWFKTIQELTAIYGVGPSTARKWYEKGIRSVDDVKNTPSLWSNDKRICNGLAFFEDLRTPVTIEEAKRIKDLVQELIPNACIEITGGFRRGKAKGHDLDLLITNTEGTEIELLEELYSKLKRKGLILHGEIEKHHQTHYGKTKSKTIDNFDKCFTILKYDGEGIIENSVVDTEVYTLKDVGKLANVKRSWKAIRVDLVVCPYSQWPYALVGWTGNKMFNRSLRDYAQKELNMRLTSHGLYDIAKQENVVVSNEHELFSRLKLKYLEPFERNA